MSPPLRLNTRHFLFGRSLAFDSPAWLALLALLPALWWLSYGGLSGLGRFRRLGALALRSLVYTLVVFALADAQFRKTSDRITVLYLLDQSLSIPEANREAMRTLVNRLVAEHRRDDKQDRAGVIVFGADAEVELPPVDFDYEIARFESTIDRRETNLAAAMNRALSLFPPDSSKRIVLVTDGNENAGDALREARALADAGVSVDVLPTPLPERSETAVDKVAVPTDVRIDQPFEARVVLDHRTSGTKPTKGRLRVVRRAGDIEQVVSDSEVTLRPGKNAFSVRETLDRADFYTYEARFVPEGDDDGSSLNNAATAFTHVRGKGQALVIEDWEHPGEFDRLVEALARSGVEVTLRGSNQLFAGLADLQRYDTVVLANTPRTSGFGDASGGTVVSDTLSGFSDEQVEMLVQNTEELGCGLVMIGGDRSFGAGGWDDTPLEKAMPVDFQIKAAKVTPIGALMIVLDKSGSMSGEKLDIARAAAAAAVRVLGPRDYVGVVAFDERPSVVVPMRRVEDGRAATARIDRIGVGGGTDMYPGMKLGFGEFDRADEAALRHMILLTDGLTPPADFAGLTAQMRRQKITVSTVSIGADSDPQLLSDIATRGGGKFYLVRNPRAVPRIFQREARRVSRPLVRELSPAAKPVVLRDHEMVRGVAASLPPLSGYVMTTLKESSLVEAVLRSPVPSDAESSTLLAAWTYGLGKTVALTTDAGARWADEWTAWDGYDRFFTQMVRWSMRPTGDTGNFTVATEVEEGKARVVVDALDKDGGFLDLAAIGGAAVRPDLGSAPLDFRQVAPGRYVAEFDADAPGSYLVLVNPGAGYGTIRTGLGVGYSDEFRDREANDALLESIAAVAPRGGEEGALISEATGVEFTGAEAAERIASSGAYNPYRPDLPPAVATLPVWPLLVLAASCVFVADVFVRRVQVSLAWVGPALAAVRRRVFGGQTEGPRPETMARLHSRKAEVRETSTAAGAARFEAPGDAAPGASPLEELRQPSGSTPAKKPAPTPPRPLAEEAKPLEEGYTSRLLKAKRDAMKDREK